MKAVELSMLRFCASVQATDSVLSDCSLPSSWSKYFVLNKGAISEPTTKWRDIR